ncbi:NADH-quinone oxidoreductase subunit NuoF [Aliiglaciecola sp. CAU 1673]|uniref:NADH-quinone oxidoreductase subunit NuoF n=1 Tax=Aliiglaciecola sp. CAU 1673 TaxID=3032595 RepID=UPI0023DAEF91|nr:NADH-quinone oxidoreductase subunit NuoF [Aliiglaciecola sp. CAU 1673]MDF2176651.1 NADH-quinone oxidoreductase subunit NuoF [Aliiglaciecola sp. CAU 1673]
MDKPLSSHLNIEQPQDIGAYQAVGGYQGFLAALEQAPQKVQQQVKESGLKGRGGAGFATGEKWRFVPMGDDAPKQKYLICNADEMEPGTFKDRWLMEGAPHLLLEGVMIAAYAIGASQAFIFLRGEYRLCARRLQQAIDEAKQAGLLGENIRGSGFGLNILLHQSAGRYICGEETALLNALEGKRANPRAKPPFPQVVGLFGRPTIVNNCETLCNLPGILRHGVQWYQQLSDSPDAGTKIYGISGRVKKAGLWELPMGVSAGHILSLAGGMQDGRKLRGWLPGGASTDFLLPEHLELPMGFDAIAKAGSRLGTGGIIALDDGHCPVGMVLNLLQFFAQESCGWCTPCRDGLPWAVEILSRMEVGKGTQEDLDELSRLCDFMWIGKTFCALAPGAVEPLRSALKYFADDFAEHVDKGRCRYRH